LAPEPNRRGPPPTEVHGCQRQNNRACRPPTLHSCEKAIDALKGYRTGHRRRIPDLRAIRVFRWPISSRRPAGTDSLRFGSGPTSCVFSCKHGQRLRALAAVLIRALWDCRSRNRIPNRIRDVPSCLDGLGTLASETNGIADRLTIVGRALGGFCRLAAAGTSPNARADASRFDSDLALYLGPKSPPDTERFRRAFGHRPNSNVRLVSATGYHLTQELSPGLARCTGDA
jgi:hypothetical protein